MANELLFTNAEATWLPLLVMVMTSSAIEESIVPKGGIIGCAFFWAVEREMILWKERERAAT